MPSAPVAAKGGADQSTGPGSGAGGNPDEDECHADAFGARRWHDLVAERA